MTRVHAHVQIPQISESVHEPHRCRSFGGWSRDGITHPYQGQRHRYARAQKLDNGKRTKAHIPQYPAVMRNIDTYLPAVFIVDSEMV